MLAEMSRYTRNYDDETKYMYFLIQDDELLKKCNKILDKVSNSINTFFDSDLLYHEKYLKTKSIL